MAKANFVLKNKMKSGEYRVCLRVSHLNFPAKYYTLPYSAKIEQWDKEKQCFKNNKYDFSSLNEIIKEAKFKVKDIINDLQLNKKFSYDEFWKMFNLGVKVSSFTIEDAFIEKLKQLEETKRYGSYKTYNNCYSSLLKYTSLKIQFSDIDYRFLNGFEIYHIKLGNKPNSYAGYFRILRAIYYEYCKTNDLPEPSIFKRFNISRLKNETRKKSLSKDQMKQFIEYEAPTEAQYKAKMIFLFSFYVRGINLMDMLQLTDKNIEGDILIYRRQKTGKQMQIKLVYQAQIIIKYFKNNTAFLFPYLHKNDIPKYRIRDINSNINRRLKLIGKAIGIGDITMYYARHTFAELHYKAGIRIEIISQMLGHSDLKTTQIYLRSFSDDEVDNAASKVFDSLL